MQHRRKGRVFHREQGPRKALLRSLARGLIFSNAIITTEAKAKELRPHIERLITKARKSTLAHHRQVIAVVGEDATARLKKNILPKLEKRSSGYTRITKFGVRTSDASRMARISFVD